MILGKLSNTLSLMVSCYLASSLHGQITPGSAQAIGLEPAWVAQAQLPLAGRGIVSTDLWVTNDAARQVAVVESQGTMLSVPADQLDEQNQPLGIQKAKAMAVEMATKKWKLAVAPEVIEMTIPEIRLVGATSDGLVQCYDAETGRLFWTASCGTASTPAYPAALSRQGVVVVQGQQLYLLDWTTGKHLSVQNLPTATSNAVGVAEYVDAPESPNDKNSTTVNSFAFALDYSGGVTAVGLSQSIPPWHFRLTGRAVAAPASLPDRSYMAVSTDNGWLNVFVADSRPGISFRYETGSGLAASPGVGTDAFYIGDLSGVVTKISTADRGSIAWRYRMTQSISSRPLVDQQQGLVFVCSDAGEFIALDDSTGMPVWEKSVYDGVRVRAPVAVMQGQVVCRTGSDTFAAFDTRTGQPLGETGPVRMTEAIIANDVTDRLYVVNTSGQIQCLRAKGRRLPRLLQSTPKQALESKSSRVAPADTETAGSSSESNEDLQLDEDPLGDTSSPESDTSTDSDPFGGSVDSGDEFGDGPGDPPETDASPF